MLERARLDAFYSALAGVVKKNYVAEMRFGGGSMQTDLTLLVGALAGSVDQTRSRDAIDVSGRS